MCQFQIIATHCVHRSQYFLKCSKFKPRMSFPSASSKGAAVTGKDLHDNLAIQEIIRAYQVRESALLYCSRLRFLLIDIYSFARGLRYTLARLLARRLVDPLAGRKNGSMNGSSSILFLTIDTWRIARVFLSPFRIAVIKSRIWIHWEFFRRI